MIEKPYAITHTCKVCRGRGHVTRPHCALCGRDIPPEDEWWAREEFLLPCGHEEAQLQMEVACEVCAGNGRVTRHLTPAEWEAYQRRRRLRWIFVILLSLVFLSVMAFIILREPQLLCGSPWYTMIGTGIIFAASRRRFS